MIEGVLCDLSGVLYVGDQVVPGARDAIISLAAAGMPVRFMTNATRTPKKRILQNLSGMGLEVAEADLFTPVMAARSYIREHDLGPHLLVHPNIQAELADLASSEPNAVLMGDAGHAFTYESMNAAFRVLIEGAPLLAMGNNRYFQERDGLSLDLGPFVRALEYAVGTHAVVVGKPAPEFFLAAVRSIGVDPARVVMLGDDHEADVDGALAAGLQGILVRTGKYRPGDEDRLRHPGARVFDDIAAATDEIL